MFCILTVRGDGMLLVIFSTTYTQLSKANDEVK